MDIFTIFTSVLLFSIRHLLRNVLSTLCLLCSITVNSFVTFDIFTFFTSALLFSVHHLLRNVLSTLCSLCSIFKIYLSHASWMRLASGVSDCQSTSLKVIIWYMINFFLREQKHQASRLLFLHVHDCQNSSLKIIIWYMIHFFLREQKLQCSCNSI